MSSLLALIGALLFAQPFVMPWSPWSWSPKSEAYLAGADINADLASLNEQGLTLRMKGERPISVILPPVAWNFDTPPVLRVVLALSSTVAAAENAVPVQVRVLWQEASGAAYRFAGHDANLSHEPVAVTVPIPELPWRIHRLGVQVVGRDKPLIAVRIIKLELPDLPVAQRAALAWRSFSEPEPIANHSVNFLRGPTILGRSLNGMLLLLTLTGIGAAGALAAARRRPMTRTVWLAPLLIAWFVVDGWATWNLARQERTERETFAVLTPEQQLARTWGEDVAWAAEALRRHAPPGATFAVLSDDPFYPAHRLDYLLVPVYRRVEEPAQADYVAVIRASDERLSAVQNPTMHLHRVASKESNVVLLERRVAR